MRILVFVKQVPEVSDTHFDPDTKTILRAGVKNIINPYDRRAISEAVRYRNLNGGQVTVATMGPPQAREALLEALAMGADKAVHIEDARLAGSDTLVTARVLATAARKIGFDILLAGQHSTDSETGQVPPAIAELLKIPSAVAVNKIEYAGSKLRLTCETDSGSSIMEMDTPAVISTAERLIKPIKVKDFDPNAAQANAVGLLRLEDLDLKPEEVGLAGSPTWVESIHQELIQRQPTVLQGLDEIESARRIVEMIQQRTEAESLPFVPPNLSKDDRKFWCAIESDHEGIRPVSLEMLSSAASMAASHGGKVSAIVIGPPLGTAQVQQLSGYGADNVYHALATAAHPDEVVALYSQKIAALRPFSVFFPATSAGKLLAPRIAARLNLGLTGDCVGLHLDEEGRLVQLKPAFGGNIVARIYSKTFPQMATVRPGALPSTRPRDPQRIPVIAWTFPANIERQFKIDQEITDRGSEAAKMESARIIVCVGTGLGQENIGLAFRIAELCNGAVGATRRVVDQGWVPRQHQIGLTGKFVAPSVYLGLGVSGRYNHTIGIQKSNKIVAINQDPNAEILKIADLGILGDCVATSRRIIELLEEGVQETMQGSRV